MTLTTFTPWPRVEFGPAERELIIARDIPLGEAWPLCWACGEPITSWLVHIHHVLYRSRQGDGRPSNGIPVHDMLQPGNCHKTLVHDRARAAAEQDGWVRSRYARKPDVYRSPIRCPRRGWVVLLDEPDEVTGLYWRPAP